MSLRELVERTLEKNKASFATENGVEMILPNGKQKVLIRYKGLVEAVTTDSIPSISHEQIIEETKNEVVEDSEEIKESEKEEEKKEESKEVENETAKLEETTSETPAKSKRGRKPKNAAAE